MSALSSGHRNATGSNSPLPGVTDNLIPDLPRYDGDFFVSLKLLCVVQLCCRSIHPSVFCFCFQSTLSLTCMAPKKIIMKIFQVLWVPTMPKLRYAVHLRMIGRLDQDLSSGQTEGLARWALLFTSGVNLWNSVAQGAGGNKAGSRSKWNIYLPVLCRRH